MRFSNHAAMGFMLTVLAAVTPFGHASIPLGGSLQRLEIEHWAKTSTLPQSAAAPGSIIETGECEDGTVYVIDFWATWCAPCVASFEKLTGLAKKYAEQDVAVIAVTEEPLPKIVEFLASSYGAEKELNYTRAGFAVAVDPDGSTMNALLPEALRENRPMLAIIDRKGRLAWLGTPTGEQRAEMEAALDAIVRGEWDTAAHARTLAERERIAAEQKRIVDEEDWDAARSRFWNDGPYLTRLAFAMAFNYGGRIQNTDPDAARAFAERGVELSEGRDPYALHTLARVEFNAGNRLAAIQAQERAVAVNADSPRAEQYAEYYASTLEQYRSAEEP